VRSVFGYSDQSVMSNEVLRIEEYTGLIQGKVVCAWQAPDAAAPWLPTEFMLSQYITRILITGRASALSSALTADPSWTQVWRTPGAKEWSCLMGILGHMPGPVLIVIGPDIVLSAKLVGALNETCARGGQTTAVILRQIGGGAGWVGDHAAHVFFPVLDGTKHLLLPVIQAEVAAPKHLDFKTVLPQLAAQGYALTVADGVWQWYKPTDSTGLATLTVPQIARQLQILGSVLNTMGV
jgi:hypothetical protein